MPLRCYRLFINVLDYKARRMGTSGAFARGAIIMCGIDFIVGSKL